MAGNDPELASYPPELIEHVAQQARRDADLTFEVFKAIGLHPLPDPGLAFSQEFLLGFGAAMRLLAWESDRVDLGEYGLPDARTAALRVLVDASSRHLDPLHPHGGLALSLAVFEITVNGWAWTGQRDFQADIRLGTVDEDAFIEIMAQFLWDHRDSPFHQGGTASP